MNATTTVHWHLRELLALKGIYQTTHLVPMLAERNVHLSREQVYRLVTQTPQRLNLDVLAALCAILGCGPEDLITFSADEVAAPRRAAGASKRGIAPAAARPSKTTIRRPSSNDG
ncbi:MAG: XRE family transcriptional regulator [Microbacteriaceae bacterium]|nr:MAG: XRE family transcriptional regulator [Microbacteriaceae bacterium]